MCETQDSCRPSESCAAIRKVKQRQPKALGSRLESCLPVIFEREDMFIIIMRTLLLYLAIFGCLGTLNDIREKPNSGKYLTGALITAIAGAFFWFLGQNC